MSGALDAVLACERLAWTDLTDTERNRLARIHKALVADGSDPDTAARMAVEQVLEG